MKQGELSLPVSDFNRHVGISEQWLYCRKKQLSGHALDQARELKQVLKANTRLKNLVAERSLDKAALPNVLTK